MKLKSIGILVGLAVVTGLLMCVAFKSAKLKELAIKLLKAKQDLELKDIQTKQLALRKQVYALGKKRVDKTAAFKRALSEYKSKRNGS